MALTSFAGHLASARTQGLAVMALRPDSRFPGEMDDIIITNVDLFRARAISDKNWLMWCYLGNGERITFEVRIARRPKRVVMQATETPPDWLDLDTGAPVSERAVK